MACPSPQAIAMARLAPSTVAHVLRLVGRAYLDTGRGPRLRHVHTSARRLGLSARAPAAEMPDDGTAIVRTPRKMKPPRPPQAPPMPTWAWLEPDTHRALFRDSRRSDSLMSAATFRARFDGLKVSPALLLPYARLCAVFGVFNAQDTTELDWLWLKSKIQACREAEGVDFSEIPGSRVLLRHLGALVWAKLGDFEDAAIFMSSAISKAMADDRASLDRYPEYSSQVIEEYIKTVLAAGRPEDAAEVVCFSGGALQRLLTSVPGNFDPSAPSTRIRRAFQRAFQSMDDPWAWVSAHSGPLHGSRIAPKSLDGTAKAMLAGLVADTMHTVKAFTFWRKLTLKDDAMYVPHSIASKLASDLANQEFYSAAHHVIAVLRERGGLLPHNSLSRELWIYANEGKPTESLKVWDEINLRHRPTPDDRLAVATAFAVNGQVDAAKKALEQLGTPEDSVEALRLLQRAAILAEDDELALEYLDRIAKVEPSLLPFESQLRLYAQQGKTESAITVFGRILELGLAPTLETYTSFISVFANAADHINAQNVFNSMRASGIEPDAVAWCALLNAYIEAGAWQEAATLSDGVPPEMSEHPDILTTMLKAYVIGAAPLEPVLRLFRSITLPPVQAWALAIQSAADNDNMVLARSLFVEMDAATKLDSLAPQPNVYILSILLAAYLRMGDRESARAVYDTMISRDFVPTSITYGVITNSFACAPGESSFKQAHNFAMSVYGQIKPGERTHARGKAMENVFTPLLIASVRTGNLGQAKHYYDLIAENGGNSRSLATKLMEAYRSVGQLRPLYRVWLKLFGQACKAIPPHPAQPTAVPDGQHTRARNNVLAIPFSIAIRAFGDAGLHDRLKKLWTDMRTAGFGRDSQNYNHYAVALAKTGDVEGAFHIVDRVLMPRYAEVKERYHEAMRAADGQLLAVEADTTPDDVEVDIQDGDDVYDAKMNTHPRDVVDDEHAFDADDAAADRDAERTTSDVAEPAHRPPNRRHQYHPDVPPQLLEGETAVDLSILRQWRPSDVLWRPSVATLAVLDHAYRQLEDQKAYRAWIGIGTDGEEEAPEVHLPEFGKAVVVREPDGSSKRMSPRLMLARLNRKYGRVVSLIMFHRRKRQQFSQEEKRERRW